MDVKELPFYIPGEKRKCLNIICDASSLHVMAPLKVGETESSQVLLRTCRGNWARPYMRPKWLR
eukprot:4798638-Pyramimonas_sp.AAC.1